MSKGYGIKQRLILERLAALPKDEWFYLIDLLPKLYHFGLHCGHQKQRDEAEYQAFHRAAQTLARAGVIKLDYASGSGYGKPNLAIHHPSTEIVKERIEKPGMYNFEIIYKCISIENCID